MQRIDIRTPSEWLSFDALLWKVMLVLVILLLVLWFLVLKQSPFACCHTADDHVASAMDTPVSPEPEVAIAEPEPIAPEVSVPPKVLSPAKLKLALAEGQLVLEGDVASDEERQQYLDLAAGQFGAENIVDRLRIVSDTEGFGGKALFSAWLTALTGKNRAAIQLNGNRLLLLGSVESDTVKQTLEDAVRSAYDVDGKILAIDNQVDVVKAEDVIDCEATLNAAAIEFSSGSAELTPAGKRTLNGLVPCLQASSYDIIGHTDSSGSAVLNKRLSEQRAMSAKAYLVSLGLPDGALFAVGAGAEQPIATNTTVMGRAKNRRIQFSPR